MSRERDVTRARDQRRDQIRSDDLSRAPHDALPTRANSSQLEPSRAKSSKPQIDVFYQMTPVMVSFLLKEFEGESEGKTQDLLSPRWGPSLVPTRKQS